MTMTPRERYRETLLFGNPDKVPFNPGGPRESTLEAWHMQGLPEDVPWPVALREAIGLDPEPQIARVSHGVDFRMIPQFEEKVIEHKDGHYIVQDWMGAITEISDKYDYTYIRRAKDFVTRKWHKFPVETREDWEEMKKRFDPATPSRYPDDFDARAEALKDRPYRIQLNFNGPFWQLREWLGFENLCMMFIEQPDWIHEMITFWADFVSDVLAPTLEKIEIDSVMINEDMAYKAHSMISPDMVREFLQPAYRQWVKQIKAGGCPIIIMDCDGYIAELIPTWIEVGINSTWPVEVAAHNDIVAFRKKYGTQISYGGGVDKRAIAKGGDVMRAELTRLEPVIKAGGFLPGCDHGVPPDISWPNFIDYSRLLAQMTGWL
jgi:uroporphyrinogen decarboxylase